VVDGVEHRLHAGIQGFGHGPSRSRGYARQYRPVGPIRNRRCGRGSWPMPGTGRV
jgi:hypothetical protein